MRVRSHLFMFGLISVVHHSNAQVCNFFLWNTLIGGVRFLFSFSFLLGSKCGALLYVYILISFRDLSKHWACESEASWNPSHTKRDCYPIGFH